MADYVLKNGSNVFTIGGNKILTTRKPSTFTYQNYAPGLNYPTGIIYDSANSNSRLFVTNQAANTVTVHDKTTFAIIATITGFNQPFSMCIDPVTANNRMFVSNNGGNNISIVDLETLIIVETIDNLKVGGSFAKPNGIAIDAATNRMFVCNFGSGMLFILNASTFALINTIQVATNNQTISLVNCLIDPYVVNRLFITDYGNSRIYILNATTYAILTTITLTNAAGIAFDPNAPRFVAASFGGNLHIYDIFTLSSYSGFSVNDLVCNAGLCFDPDLANNRLMVCVQGLSISSDGTLGVVNEISY